MGERRNTYLEKSQSLTHYRFNGALYPRMAYGLETFRDPDCETCRECGTAKGQLHEPLCDYEQCPACGEQVMFCDCAIFTDDAVAA